jgi:Domain of unknown function (DUF222)/HNH endonuclease
MDSSEKTRDTVISAFGDAVVDLAAAQSRMVWAVAECDRTDVWEYDGCYSYAQWVSARLHISRWAARRLITAARTLPRLPVTRAALASGRLGLDKVVELCRFATPDTEAALVTWARGVLPMTIRERADLANRQDLDDVVDAQRSRTLRWEWSDDGLRLGLWGELPADQGAIVTSALDRMAGRLPAIVDDDDTDSATGAIDARRADALVALCSARIADDADPDRATVVVHAPLQALSGQGDELGCGISGGGILHPETVRRLACDCRLEVSVEDPDGLVVGIGRASRTPPAWLKRALMKRDRGCQFPGCGGRRFLHCHHIWHWIRGGPTELQNLVLLCSFHHRMVHEFGWGVELGAPGTSRWYRPNGSRYEPGPKEEERGPPQLVAV